MGKPLGLQWFLKHLILSYLNAEGVEYFFRLLSVVAVYAESAIISIIPSECTVSPLWPDLAPPLSNRDLNTKVVMLMLLRVSLLSLWEFDLPRGRKRKHFTQNLFWFPLLQSISFKQNQGELRRSGSLSNTHVPTLNMLNMYGSIFSCHIYFPNFLVEWQIWCQALAPVPHPSYSKLPNLEVRNGCYSKKSWDLNTHDCYSSWSISYWLRFLQKMTSVSKASVHEIYLIRSLRFECH